MTRRDDPLRAAVGLVGTANMAAGAWALTGPHSFYSAFPGFGHHWVSAAGPYDEHLVRDVGGGLLALGLLLLWAALAPRAGLLRPALAVSLVFSVPHFAYHAASSDDLATGDNVANLVGLGLAVLLPAALLWTTRPQRPAPAAVRAGGGGARIAALPARKRGPLVRYAYHYSRRHFGAEVAPLALLGHDPLTLAGNGAMELAIERSHQVDGRLKELGATMAALVTGCAFCVDLGAWMLQRRGLDEDSIVEMPRYRESSAFKPLERLVLEYAEALSATPVEVSDDLFARLREHFDDAQLLELTNAITFEIHRSRLYRAFGIGVQGLANCRLPQRDRSSSPS
jgi:AhpD family alkylhydroperoxidase